MASPQKRRVSKALHAEISEYTALLRALKTRDLLDLTTQLTAPDITRRDPSRAGPSDLSHPANSETRPVPYKRDLWTRWPLVFEEIYIPEWTLEDEVYVVARQCIKRHRSQPDSPPELDDDLASVDEEEEEDLDSAEEEQPGPDENEFKPEPDGHKFEPEPDDKLEPEPDDKLEPEPDEDQFELEPDGDEPDEDEYDSEDLDTDFPPYVEHLTTAVRRFLHYMLTLIAYHTPLRPHSMLNRIAVINWEILLNSLAGDTPDTSHSNGLVKRNPFLNVKMLETAHKRLQNVYGPPALRGRLDSQVPEPTKGPYNIFPKMQFSRLVEQMERDLYAVGPEPCQNTTEILDRMRRKRKRKGKTKEDFDVESDDPDFKPPRKVAKLTENSTPGNAGPSTLMAPIRRSSRLQKVRSA